MERRSGGEARNELVATWDDEGHLTVEFVDREPDDTASGEVVKSEPSAHDQLLPDTNLDPTGRIVPSQRPHALGRFCNPEMHVWGD